MSDTAVVSAHAVGPTEGQITYYAARFGNQDLVGDIVDKGAFDAWLADAQRKDLSVPVVWSHNWGDAASVIGYSRARDDFEITDLGLLVTAHVDLQNETARIVHANARKGILQASFSYDVDREKTVNGANHLQAVSVIETGPCLKGANPLTGITTVKIAAHRKSAQQIEDTLWRTRVGFVVSKAKAAGRTLPPEIVAEAERLGVITDIEVEFKEFVDNAQQCVKCGKWLTAAPAKNPHGFGYLHRICVVCGTIELEKADAGGLTVRQKKLERDRLGILYSRKKLDRRAAQLRAQKTLAEWGVPEMTEAEMYAEIERLVDGKKSETDREFDKLERILGRRAEGW